jgi:hypothetical protein
MTQSHPALAVGTLSLTAVIVLAILVANHKAEGEVSLFGVPPGEVMVSFLSIGLVAALTFTGNLDMRIAGTLLGAHVGYHAAASRRRT